MEYLIYCIQTVGILIPLVGIFALLRRTHQNSNSMYLMLANIGCLLMNRGYLLVMSADSAEQASMINRMEYLGNVLFYYFFIWFLVSYLWKNYPRWPFYVWAFLDGAGVVLYWNDTLRNFLFGGATVFQVEKIDFLGIYTAYMGESIVCRVRYSWISLLLAFMLIYSNLKLVKIQGREERKNMARLIGAQFVIMVSLIAYLYFKPFIDFVPLLASLSILSIILSVLADEFYGITEMGHEWVFEQMEDAFIIVDKNYGYLDANSYALNIFDELKRALRQMRISDDLYQLFIGAEEIYQIGEKYYEKKIVDIIDKNAVVGYSMLLVDVTKQQELMKEVQQEKQRADAANQAKSAFVSNVSHEIRTPMNAIVGMTQILLRKELPKQERDYILNIQNSGNALLAIINDILDMSKIESGKMELVEEEYDFMEMLNDLGMILLNRIGAKPVELIYDIDPELPERLYGDALRIRQIIINLMNNATKFTEQGYVALTVHVEKAEGEDVELVVSVKDTGQGIREEDLPKLFGSFQQVDTKKNHNKEGTGLGLSISKQLVELMHGSIGVRSEYGKGSEFYFNIHQKLVSDVRAAKLADMDGQVFVAGTMKNEVSYQALQKLAEQYQLKFVPDILADSAEEGRLYYFTDCYNQLSEEERKRLTDCGGVVYHLQNPMLESEEPEGTETIHKPLYTYNFCNAINTGRVTQAEQAEEREEELSFTAPEAKLLIVDDVEINRIVVEEMLEPLQLQIDMAENGAEAVKWIQEMEYKYDLILMDHFMPVMDGLEAAQTIRKLEGDYFQNVPIIALTANTAKEQQEEYLQNGMSDFVAKPIMMEELYRKIRKWLPQEKIR